VAYLLKAKIMESADIAIARERLLNTPIARPWLSSRHVKAATDTHETIKELLEAAFSVRSVPRLYNEDQVPLPVSPSRVRVKNLEESREKVCRQSVERCSSEKLEAGS
jgi:hypothetical protein